MQESLLLIIAKKAEIVYTNNNALTKLLYLYF